MLGAPRTLAAHKRVQQLHGLECAGTTRLAPKWLVALGAAGGAACGVHTTGGPSWFFLICSRFSSLACVNWYCRCLWPSQTARFPLEELVPLPALKTKCGSGYGLAACPALSLLVTSHLRENSLSVWGMPGGASGVGGAFGGPGTCAGAGASAGGGVGGGPRPSGLRPSGLPLLCTLGGAGSAAPMQFKFWDGDSSGLLAFTPPTATTASGSSSSARPLLLVTDAGHEAVHLVDVVGRSHAGYLASPGSIAGARGVAASGASPLVAVSAWKNNGSGDHVVVVYAGSGAVWEAVRVIGGGFGDPGPGDGQLWMPYGLRFSGDWSGICVADYWNSRASVFRVGDGVFVRHMATGLDGPYDVEEVEGGWLVACWDSHRVEFVGDGADGDGGGRPSLGKAGGGWGSGDGEFCGPTTLAVVPGLGVVVSEVGNGGRLQVFATPDALAIAAMSPNRVAWMTAVARGVFRRKGAMLQRGSDVGLGQAGGSKRARTAASGGAL
jgi:hypothetical protein